MSSEYVQNILIRVRADGTSVVEKLSGDLGKLGGGLGSAKREADAFGASLGRFGGQIAIWATGLFTLTKAIDAVRAGIRNFDEMRTLAASISTFTGNVHAGVAALEFFQRESEKTRNTGQELARVYRDILPMAMRRGLDPTLLRDFTVALSQLATVSGQTLEAVAGGYEQILSGHARGLNAFLQTIGKTGKDLLTASDADIAEWTTNIVTKMQMAEKMGQTFSSTMAKVGESILDAFARGMMGGTAAVGTGLANIQTAFSNPEFLKSIERIGEAFVKALTPVAWLADKIVRTLAGLGEVPGIVKDIGKWLVSPIDWKAAGKWLIGGSAGMGGGFKEGAFTVGDLTKGGGAGTPTATGPAAAVESPEAAAKRMVAAITAALKAGRAALKDGAQGMDKDIRDYAGMLAEGWDKIAAVFHKKDTDPIVEAIATVDAKIKELTDSQRRAIKEAENAQKQGKGNVPGFYIEGLKAQAVAIQKLGEEFKNYAVSLVPGQQMTDAMKQSLDGAAESMKQLGVETKLTTDNLFSLHSTAIQPLIGEGPAMEGWTNTVKPLLDLRTKGVSPWALGGAIGPSPEEKLARTTKEATEDQRHNQEAFIRMLAEQAEVWSRLGAKWSQDFVEPVSAIFTDFVMTGGENIGQMLAASFAQTMGTTFRDLIGNISLVTGGVERRVVGPTGQVEYRAPGGQWTTDRQQAIGQATGEPGSGPWWAQQGLNTAGAWAAGYYGNPQQSMLSTVLQSEVGAAGTVAGMWAAAGSLATIPVYGWIAAAVVAAAQVIGKLLQPSVGADYEYGIPTITGGAGGLEISWSGLKNITAGKQRQMEQQIRGQFEEFWNGYWMLALKYGPKSLLPKLSDFKLTPRVGRFEETPGPDFGLAASQSYAKHWQQWIEGGLPAEIAQMFFEPLASAWEDWGGTKDRFKQIWDDLMKLDPKLAMEKVTTLMAAVDGIVKSIEFIKLPTTLSSAWNYPGIFGQNTAYYRVAQEQNQGFAEKVRDIDQRIYDLFDNIGEMTSSQQVAAAKEINDLMSQRVEIEKGLLREIMETAQSITRSYGAQTDVFKTRTMSPNQQYQYWQQRADQLFGSIANAKTPQQVAQIWADIQETLGKVTQAGEAAGVPMADLYAAAQAFLDKAYAAVQAKLAEFQTSIEQVNGDFMARVGPAMDAWMTKLQDAGSGLDDLSTSADTSAAALGDLTTAANRAVEALDSFATAVVNSRVAA